MLNNLNPRNIITLNKGISFDKKYCVSNIVSNLSNVIVDMKLFLPFMLIKLMNMIIQIYIMWQLVRTSLVLKLTKQ